MKLSQISKKMVKNRVIRICLFFVSFLFSFCFAMSVSTIASISSKANYDCLISDIIENNKKNDLHKTYWTVRPIEVRTNWLGGDVKPWLYSMSAAWSIFADGNHNYAFMFNTGEKGNTLILDSNDKYIPYGVIATPTPSSIKALNFDYVNFSGKTISYDGKEGMYISKSLYEKIGLIETKLCIFGKFVTNIKFDGIVKPNKNDVFDSLNIQDFIVVPSTKAYDMENYTGQTTYVCTLGNDYYQNLYYVTKIFFMNEFLDKKNAYLSSFVDVASDLTKPYELLESNIQNSYLSLVKNGGHSMTNPVFLTPFIFGLVTTSVCIFILIRKKILKLETVFNDNLFGMFLSLILLFGIAMLLFKFSANLAIWTASTMLITFIVCVCFIIGMAIAKIVLKKYSANNLIDQNDNAKGNAVVIEI